MEIKVAGAVARAFRADVAARPTAAVSPGPGGPKLLRRMPAAMRSRHYSQRTERTFCRWVERFCHFNNLRSPDEMAEPEINAFLTHHAVKTKASASTQDLAFSALSFLYHHVLERAIGDLDAVIRARKPKRLPLVMTCEEIKAVLANLYGKAATLMRKKRMTCSSVLTAVLCCVAWTSSTSNAQDGDDWRIIWQRPTPVPTTVRVKQLGGLGKDLENRQWLMISTQYHQVYYQPSADKNKVSEVCVLIDNVYTFLEGRSPVKPKTLIKAFLVPDEMGRSRCDRTHNAMRTGDQGDVPFIVTSLLHEETHLFNFAFLADVPQGWWAGEFACQYFQQRVLWQAQGKDVRQEVTSRLPNGPGCRLNEIDKRGKAAFNEAFSAFFFLEEKYGRQELNRFRQRCLEESKRTKGGPLSDSVFAEVFGKNINQLESEWLQFYGWKTQERRESGTTPYLGLQTKISYATDKASVQTIVREMANKAGLQYDWAKSQSRLGRLCKRWVMNVRVENRPLEEALKEVLDPLGACYKLEGNKIVLYKKPQN